MARSLILSLVVLLAGCPGSVDNTADGSSADGPIVDGPTVPKDRGPDSAAPFCGDGKCDLTESCHDCAGDCGACIPQTDSFEPIADAYVDEGAPSSNHGSATVLLSDQGPEQQVLLRFEVAGVTGPIVSAKLRLHVTNGSSDGPAVYLTTDPWTESGVTWSNRPQPSGSPIHDIAALATGWVEVDVTSAVQGNGSVSFLLVPTSSNGADFNSRESANKPALLVETLVDPPRDAGPTGDAGPTATRFSFFAVGDTRSNQNICQMNFQSMSQLDPSAIGVFNSGDLTADGEDSQWQTHSQAVMLGSGGKVRMDLTGWDPAHIRYFGIVGNHDTHVSSWLTNWNKYLTGQQGLGHNGTDGVYFSVKYGNALFIVLDSENFSSAQTAWLQQELTKAAGDPSIVWKFAFYHHPVYPCNYKSPWSQGIPWVREFEKHGVDIVFNGHAHVYERTCPMVGGECQQGGVIYVISGGGGAGTGDVETNKTMTSGSDTYDCSAVVPVAKGNWHHYCHIQIDGSTLSYACYSHDATSNPEDTHTITK